MRDSSQSVAAARSGTWVLARLCAVALLAGASAAFAAQAASPAAPNAQGAPAMQTAPAADAAPAAIPAPVEEGKEPRSADRRRAAKLYLESSKQYLNGQFEMA